MAAGRTDRDGFAGMSWSSITAVTQGAVYLLTGLWPLASRRSFERVTGRKEDFWLVQTIGVLIGVIGGVLLWSGLRGRPLPEVRALGIGTAATLAGADFLFVSRKRVPPVYLVDAAGEVALIGSWLLGEMERPPVRYSYTRGKEYNLVRDRDMRQVVW